MNHPQNIDDVLKNEEIMKIARKAANKFYNYLTLDEINTCILNAIWKALNKFDAKYGSKFTTYLYNGVIMECMTQKKFNCQKPIKSKIKNNIKIHPDIEKIDMMDEIIKCGDPELIYDYFYNGKSIKEIAIDRGVSGETIRIKIKKCISKIKKTLKK